MGRTISTSREEDKSFIAAHPQFTFVLIAFLSWAALSSYWAEEPGRAYDTSWRYLQNMILFLIVYTAIRQPQARQVARPGRGWRAPRSRRSPRS